MDKGLTKEARFWDKAADKYSRAPIADPDGYEATIQAVLKHLNSNASVLEIGCGTGTTALRLAVYSGSYLGTDISPEMIRIARKKAEAAKQGSLTFDVQSADAVIEPDPHFDVILGFNLLHLVPDPAQALAAVYAQLKPGGLFISKTPCLKLMNPLIRLVIPVMQAFGKAPTVHLFNPAELQTLLLGAGFESVEQSWHGTKGRDFRAYHVCRKV